MSETEPDTDIEGQRADQREKAQVELNKIRDHFAAQFDVWPEIGRKALAPTGEEYIEVYAGTSIKSMAHDTPELALEAFRHRLSLFIPRKGETLYWRILPEIDHFLGRWKVYARLLVSSRQCRATVQRPSSDESV